MVQTSGYAVGRLFRASAVVATLVAASACISRSSPGQFVTDVQVVGERLAVLYCNTEYVVTRFDKRSDQFSAAGCEVDRLALPVFEVDVAAAPEACRDTVHTWHRVREQAAAVRAHAWSTFPATCQAYLEDTAR